MEFFNSNTLSESDFDPSSIEKLLPHKVTQRVLVFWLTAWAIAVRNRQCASIPEACVGELHEIAELIEDEKSKKFHTCIWMPSTTGGRGVTCRILCDLFAITLNRKAIQKAFQSGETGELTIIHGKTDGTYCATAHPVFVDGKIALPAPFGEEWDSFLHSVGLDGGQRVTSFAGEEQFSTTSRLGLTNPKSELSIERGKEVVSIVQFRSSLLGCGSNSIRVLNDQYLSLKHDYPAGIASDSLEAAYEYCLEKKAQSISSAYVIRVLQNTARLINAVQFVPWVGKETISMLLRAGGTRGEKVGAIIATSLSAHTADYVREKVTDALYNTAEARAAILDRLIHEFAVEDTPPSGEQAPRLDLMEQW